MSQAALGLDIHLADSYLAEIEHHIGEDLVQEALSKLQDFVRDFVPQLKHDVILLSRRFRNLTSEVRRGLARREDLDAVIPRVLDLAAEAHRAALGWAEGLDAPGGPDSGASNGMDQGIAATAVAETVGGARFRAEIDARLDAARAVVVLWSEHAIQSDWVIYEADRAHKAGKLVPLRVASLNLDRVPAPYPAVLNILLLGDDDALTRTLQGLGLPR
jgi:hypothetical protein